MATILLRRRGGWQDALRSYRVFIDGIAVGDIRRNAEFSVSVEPGLHTVQLKIDWLGSPETRVAVEANQVCILECGPAAKSAPYWVDLKALETENTRQATAQPSGSRSSGPRHSQEAQQDHQHGSEAESNTGFADTNRPHSKHTATHWHEVLGVQSDASITQIRTAYRRLQSQYHPDKVAHLGKDLIALAEQKSKEINRAFDEAMKTASDRSRGQI